MMARDASEIRAELEAEADRHRATVAALLAQLPTPGQDTPLVAALFRLLWDKMHRLTGGQIADALSPRTLAADPGFSERNITDTLTALVKSRRWVNHPRDPGDGLGRGYGLPEWDQQ